jgi:biofilm PGA synthesis N-glycosyltransferase PgaC
MGTMFQIIEIVTIVTLGIFLGFYMFYLATCLVYVKTKFKKGRIFSLPKVLPKVSIIIPTYNEVQVIGKKLENLQLLNYPKDRLEIVFVDGGSADGTADLLGKLAENKGFFSKVVQQGTRKGFNNAVIEGFHNATGEIICITGAETEYDPEALNTMVRRFSDPSVGSVTGKQRIRNIEEGYSPRLEGAYRSLYDFLREAESCIDSPFDIKGEISAARRDIIAHLVKNPTLAKKGCIDCCISFQAKMDGYTTVFEPEATYYELSPRTIKDSFKQQIRRAATLIENMMAFKTIILKRRYGAFGGLIMPAHFLMLLVLPFLLFIGSIGMVLSVILNPSNYLAMGLLGIAVVALILLRQLQAFIKTQVVLLAALLKLLFGTETQKFARLATTRP